MLNWLAILRRILKLYRVHSTRELGMALGIPLRIGEDGHADEPLPWPVLEMIVADRGVSWDWLLTGHHFLPAAESGKNATKTRKKKNPDLDEDPIVKKCPLPSRPSASAKKPPRIETRELARTLLPSGEVKSADARPANGWEYASSPSAPPEPADAVNARREEEVIRELEDVKASMQKELARVEEILRKRGG